MLLPLPLLVHFLLWLKFQLFKTIRFESKTIKNLNDSLNYLITSRPTAVNLANALNDIKQLLQKYNETDIIDEKYINNI